MSANWTQPEAIALCKAVESLCPPFGCHVALTGGLLYKEGERKDCDLIFYRIRQSPRIDRTALIQALHSYLGISLIKDHGFVVKLKQANRGIDAMFPEHVDVRPASTGGGYN